MKGISTVLTTLIILVASVVLGTGVVLYGTSYYKSTQNPNVPILDSNGNYNFICKNGYKIYSTYYHSFFGTLNAKDNIVPCNATNDFEIWNKPVIRCDQFPLSRYDNSTYKYELPNGTWNELRC